MLITIGCYNNRLLNIRILSYRFEPYLAEIGLYYNSQSVY